MLSLTLYLICPDDAREERLAAESIMERLQARYWRSLRLEVISAEAVSAAARTAEAFAPERPPLRPDECDIVIAILAGKLPSSDAAGEIGKAIAAGIPEIRLYRRKKKSAELDRFWKQVVEPVVLGSQIRHESHADAAAFSRTFEVQLEEILRARLQKSRHPETLSPRPIEGPPYRGRAAYRFEDAGLFFGRDRLIAEGLKKLRANRDNGRAFLLVHGEPGSGRTSLIQAGLAPRLCAEGFITGTGAWRRAEMRQPGIGSLAGALLEALPELERMKDPWTRERLEQALTKPEALTQATLVGALDLVSVAKPAQLLLVLEDFEAVLAAKERETFLRAISLLAKSRRIWIVAITTTSAMPKLMLQPGIAELAGPHGALALKAPAVEELRRIVRCPAMAAELQFEANENGDLSEQIIADSTGEPQILGALEFVLGELHHQRRGRLLSWSAYESLGGVRRILREGIPVATTATTVSSPSRPVKLRFFQFATAAFAFTAGALLFRHREGATDQTATTTANGPMRPSSPAEKTLAEADFATGSSLIEAGSPDEALPYLLSALRNDPGHLEAQMLLLNTYSSTFWHIPTLEMTFPEPVQRLNFGAEGSTLYTALDGSSDGFQTVLNWNVKTPEISGILKPEWNQSTGKLLISPDGRHLVVERGTPDSPANALLCDARTMRVQSVLTPSKKGGCYCWALNGTLLSYLVDAEGGTLWRICDMATGATVRETEVMPGIDWIAATMTQSSIRAISKSGECYEIPLNPKQLVAKASLGRTVKTAIFSPDSGQFLACFDDGSRRFFEHGGYTPNSGAAALKPLDDVPKWFQSPDFLAYHSWSRDEAKALEDILPLSKNGKKFHLDVNPRDLADLRGGAPFHEDGDVTAIATLGSRVAVATSDGKVTIHSWLANATGDGAPLRSNTKESAGSWQTLAASKAGTLERKGAKARLRLTDGKIQELPDEAVAIAVEPGNERSLLAAAEELQKISLLEEGEKAAFLGATEVTVVSLENHAVTKIASLPVAGAGSLQFLNNGSLAVATASEVQLFEGGKFTRQFTLPLPTGNGPAKSEAWAEDSRHGWLAYFRDGLMQIWSTRSGRLLAANLKVDSPEPRLEFTERDGKTGVSYDGGGFVPLTKAIPVTQAELSALDSLITAACGTRLDSSSRRIVFVDPAERREAMKQSLSAVLSGLLPQMANVLADFGQVPFAAENPAGWSPLWERLAFTQGSNPAKILKWAQTSKDTHWLHLYQSALAGQTDRLLYNGRNVSAGSIGQLMELADLSGDDEAERNAAWTLRNIDADSSDAVAARKLLDDLVARTKSDYESSTKTPTRALAHAEALALSGKLEEAAAFLGDKVPGDTDLTLEQAHFLVSSGLVKQAAPAVDRALTTQHSPWLWTAWLDLQKQDRSGLPARIQQAMMDANGRGSVAAKALAVALESNSLEAVAMALRHAKGMPKELGEYLTARILWLQDRKAEVYSMWPGERPDLRKLVATGDWGEWESALDWREVTRFFGQIETELESLKTHPGDTPDAQRRLATKLMAPETAATFGGKRVRDALLDLALAMSNDKASASLVHQIVEQVRLAGADPVKCLRAEARSLFATGQPTTAYSCWIQILDDPEHGLIASDCIEAAQCLVQDQQEEAAVELLMRNSSQFAKDPNYAYQAAWVLLGMNHPEQAVTLLDRGFSIPFAQDQIQMATAMLICASELTQNTDRANEAFHQLIQYDPSWGQEANLKQLQWPQQLKQAMIVVASRNR